MADVDKVRENKLRRMAERQGLRLEKSRRRDPYALGYGGYRLVDERSGSVAAGDSSIDDAFTLDLDGIEGFLKGTRD